MIIYKKGVRIMQINGLVKTSLVDYPGQLAATLFTGGCNMRCPFCHNRNLVIMSTSTEQFSEDIIMDFLKHRRHTLEGICITGGEPTLQPDLLPFLRRLRQLPLKIKLDTNGLNPEVLSSALTENLLDFVAMDIKNSPNQYALTTGVSDIPLDQITKSITLLKNSAIDYEFRTTVIQEFHTLDDLKLIAHWLLGAKKYILQKYQSSPDQLSPQIFNAYTLDQMTIFKKAIEPFFEVVELRGF